MGGGGGIGGSYNKSSSKSESKDVTPWEYRDLRWPVANTLRGMMGGGPAYTGQFAAEMTPGESATLSRIGEMTGGQTNLASAARGETERTLSGSYLGSNPFLDASIRAAQRPMIDAFNEEGLVQRSNFARAGHRLDQSSPFARAEAIRERGLADAMGDVSTRLSAAAYEGERGRMQQAAQNAVTIDRAELQRSLDALQAQALPRLIQQYGLDKGYEEFVRRAEVALRAAGVVGDLTTIFGNQSRSSSFGVQGQVYKG